MLSLLLAPVHPMPAPTMPKFRRRRYLKERLTTAKTVYKATTLGQEGLMFAVNAMCPSYEAYLLLKLANVPSDLFNLSITAS